MTLNPKRYQPSLERIKSLNLNILLLPSIYEERDFYHALHSAHPSSYQANDNKIFIFEVLKILFALIHKKYKCRIQLNLCSRGGIFSIRKHVDFLHKYLILHYGSARMSGRHEDKRRKHSFVENASWNGSLFKAGYCRGMHAVRSDDGVSESYPVPKWSRSSS